MPVPPAESAERVKLIDRINELSHLARTAWFSLLFYLVFVGITLAGVEDADFFIPERQTALPLVGVQIPTASFFWAAPVLGAALYTYLHLFLIKLWDAHCDARPSDSDPLYPWLVNDYALIRQGDETARARPLAWLTTLITILLVWVAGPFVLAYAWWRSMPAHNEWMTLLIAFCLGTTAMIGAGSWWHAETRLRPTRTLWLRAWHKWLAVAGCTLLVATSWLRTEGTLDHYAGRLQAYLHGSSNVATVQPLDTAWWSGMPFPALLARADLADVDFVNIPDDWRDSLTARKAYLVGWCAGRALNEADCAYIEGLRSFRSRPDAEGQPLPPQAQAPDAAGPDLQLAGNLPDLARAFEEDWQKERKARLSTLTARKFIGHDLREADFDRARLEGVDFTRARLVDAEFRQAQLEGAQLGRADLEAGDFWQAQMVGAEIGGARLEGAYFGEASLKQAHLADAQLQGADFFRADLKEADLANANLEGAYLTNTNLEGADLRRVQLSAATIFRPATLRGAGLGQIDFSVLGDLPDDFAERLAEAFGDASVTLPPSLGLRPGFGILAHWSTDVLAWTDFDAAWRAHQRAIGYSPFD